MPGEPDQVHERLDEDAEVDGAVVVDLLRDHEQVLAGRGSRADADLGRDLRIGAGDLVRVLARLERAEILAVAAHEQVRAHLGGVRRVALRQRCVGDLVAGDRERLPPRELALDDRVVGARAGDPDREQDDRDVDDVAAVAAPVAADQRGERAGPRLARERLARLRAADELEPDRGEHERREGVRDQSRDRRAGPEDEQHDARRRRRRRTARGTCCPSPRSDARRQAISGPMPISSSSGSPKMRRKKS